MDFLWFFKTQGDQARALRDWSQYPELRRWGPDGPRVAYTMNGLGFLIGALLWMYVYSVTGSTPIVLAHVLVGAILSFLAGARYYRLDDEVEEPTALETQRPRIAWGFFAASTVTIILYFLN